MSIKRLNVALNSLLIAALASTVCFAQQYRAGETSGQEGLQKGPTARPFGQPNAIFEDDFFDYDAQMWAPDDVVGVDGHKHRKSGLFFAYDFAYFNIDRPGAQFGPNASVSTGSDFHWGNRYELGYIGSESQKGFVVSWLSADGSFFTDGQAPGVPNPQLNSVSMDLVELNRVFRQALSQGGHLEPYVGVRFMAVNDNTIGDTGSNRFIQRVSNSAVGGQVGARFVRAVGSRLDLTVDGNISGMFNSQNYFASDLNDTGNNSFNALHEIALSGDDFIPAVDIDVALQFNLTRDISLRAGGNIIWNWEGLARANSLPANLNPYSINSPGGFPTSLATEQMIASGLTFGLDWRR